MMKKLYLLSSLMTLIGFTLVHAQSTIDSTYAYSWGANIGWTNWKPDTTNGVSVGEYVCSGYVYGANVGWINLGSGTPTKGVYYQNLTASDFGVNQDGLGNLICH